MYLDSSANMNFSLETRHSSREQQNSKAAKDRVPSCHENQNLKYQGKLKVKTPAGPPCSDLPHELRREVNDKILVQPKSSGNRQSQYLKGKTTKDDELVKYMSNLPGYLKRMEGGKNFQDKVLNVGVLDWARLEKWKYNQKCTQASGSNNLSATGISLSLKTTSKPSTSSGATQGGTHSHQSEQNVPLSPSLNSSHKDGRSQSVKQSIRKVSHFQDLETSPNSKLGMQRKIPWTNKSNNADISKKGMKKDSDEKITSEMGNFSTNLRDDGVSLNPKEKSGAWDGEIRKRVEKMRESKINRKASLGMGASYPKSKSHGVSPGPKEKIMAGNVEIKKRTEKIQESNIDLDHQHLPGKLENIVLLAPRELSQKSSPKKSRVNLDANCTKAKQKSISGGSPLGDFCSAELRSDIPHSCPLPSNVENKTEPNLAVLGPINSQDVELSSDASYTSSYPNMTSGILSGGKDLEQNTVKHVNENAVENLKGLDLEMAEMETTRSRNPSPNRRFSFSLSRMGRSFSWKESSAVPQLSSSYVSVKSGPVKSEVSCLDDSSRQKTNGHNRTRSSPLRRLLDPLRRSRGSNPVNAAESVKPLKGSLSNLNFRPISDSALLPDENHGASRIQALLQLTIKNGLPLFKFVVDNNSSVLAATMKNLTSGKDDSGQNYTFYSVNEIKKKGSGWISQGRKQKSGGFAYNVVGRMVSSYYFSNLEGQNLKNQCMMRESVLFGVELRQADQTSPKFIPSKELAAVVVTTPIESLSHDAGPRDEDTIVKGFAECLPQGGCSYTSGEKDSSYSTTVILPGGVHSLPSKGAPSPLIKRWKSGGLCDCGGWDVGCKLRVLTSHIQNHKIPLTACLNSDRFELFEVLFLYYK